MTCAIPSGGIFGFLGSPVFSDAEDNNIGGNLTVAQLQTCWMGALRNHVQGKVRKPNPAPSGPLTPISVKV